MEEVAMGYGIADLVVAKVKHYDIAETIMNDTDIHIYEIIAKYPDQTFDDLLQGSRIASAKLKNVLRKLENLSYIKNVEGSYSLGVVYNAVVLDNIAVEAKLKNWKRALYQAFRYKWFSFQSYVVMDSSNIKPALSNLHEFEKLNIGLAEINLLGEISIHYKPSKEQPISKKMTIQFNEYVKGSKTHQ
ncbi:hypothetical protein [Dyadobacter sp. 676]|uniref:Uncharacterized protein n=1 Tax=Dyadobacter sp. 676 TaxID=3088362 RepID=A0AAU8FJ75_9BACT